MLGLTRKVSLVLFIGACLVGTIGTIWIGNYQAQKTQLVINQAMKEWESSRPIENIGEIPNFREEIGTPFKFMCIGNWCEKKFMVLPFVLDSILMSLVVGMFELLVLRIFTTYKWKVQRVSK